MEPDPSETLNETAIHAGRATESYKSREFLYMNSQGQSKTQNTKRKMSKLNTKQSQDDRIRIAKAKLEAANLRQRAASSRQQAMRYRQQSSRPIYPGQEEVAANNAAIADAKANQLDALAEVKLAEAGA
jgi:hypothetical protein